MRVALTLLPALLALGCAIAHRAPEPALPPVPQTWAAPAPSPGDALEPTWWLAFGDARLDALVREALEHNRDLAAAAARLEQAAELARIAGAVRLPQLEAALSGLRRKQNFIGFPIPGAERRVLSTTFTTLGVSLATNWEADLWGRLRAGARAALADWAAADAEVAAARLSVAGQVAKAWFGLAEAERQVALAERTVELFRATAQRVQARYAAGLRSSLDYRLALANQKSAEAELVALQQARLAARRQLELLLGRYPAAALEGSPELPPPPPPPAAGLPAELLARRPDLVAAERRLLAGGYRVAEARRALFPRLTLTASTGTSSNELRDLLDTDFSVWSLAAGLIQPVFQGGRLRAQVRLDEARALELAAQYAQRALEAYAEAERALAAEGLLAEQEQALEASLLQLASARELAEARYLAGLEDLITVLDAQRRALVTESAWLAVRRARLTNRVDLCLALGGGFDTAASPVSSAPPHSDSAGGAS